jgi:transposase
LFYREVSVVEVREVLRVWMVGAGLRTVSTRAGVDRKTARRYLEAAEAVGVSRQGGDAQLSDELIGAIVGLVRPARPDGHGPVWELLVSHREQITNWVKQGLTVVKIAAFLGREGVVVPYRTLVSFCEQCCGFVGRGQQNTVRVLDGDPGVECQVDFGGLGKLLDAASQRRRVVQALVFTAVYSRHQFVWLTYSLSLEALLAGCEAAWDFFGGVFRVLIPDNMKPIVTKADAVNPVLTQGWLDYAQHCGFVADTARVRTPTDKPRVERVINYVQRNFWAGESIVDLADAQEHAMAWCSGRAGLRLHGTIQARPVEVFAEQEQSLLLAVPAPYDPPVFRTCKVHRDYHPSRSVRRCTRSRSSTSVSKWTYGPTRSSSRCSSTARWSRFIRVSRTANGPPTRPTFPSTRASTRCATWTSWSPPRAATASLWAPMPSGCWTSRRCRGRGCARSTG